MSASVSVAERRQSLYIAGDSRRHQYNHKSHKLAHKKPRHQPKSWLPSQQEVAPTWPCHCTCQPGASSFSCQHLGHQCRSNGRDEPPAMWSLLSQEAVG